MSWYNGDYTLNARGQRKVENAARQWASAARTAFDDLTTHAEIDAAYERVRKARGEAMPEWLESDEDYQAYADACYFEWNAEAAADAAHEKLDPNYFVTTFQGDQK